MTDPTHDPVEDLPHRPMDDALTRDEIDVYLDDVAAHGQEAADERRVRWHPVDNGSAEWCMAQAVAARRAIAEAEAEGDEWKARIDATTTANTAAHRRRLAFMEAELERYALIWHDEDPRNNKTLHLPSGELATTTPAKPKLVIADEAKVRGYLMTAASTGDERVTDTVLKPPSLPTPLVSGVGKLVDLVEKDGGHVAVDKVTGEVVPGLRVDPPGPTRVTVKPLV